MVTRHLCNDVQDEATLIFRYKTYLTYLLAVRSIVQSHTLDEVFTLIADLYLICQFTAIDSDCLFVIAFLDVKCDGQRTCVPPNDVGTNRQIVTLDIDVAFCVSARVEVALTFFSITLIAICCYNNTSGTCQQCEGFLQ